MTPCVRAAFRLMFGDVLLMRYGHPSTAAIATERDERQLLVWPLSQSRIQLHLTAAVPFDLDAVPWGRHNYRRIFRRPSSPLDVGAVAHFCATVSVAVVFTICCRTVTEPMV